MLKVISLVDKVNTALDRLAKGVATYHNNLNYKVLDIHPKKPSPEQLAAFEAEYKDADIIEWQYYRTAQMLRERYDITAKQILVHNNPYSITESDWNDYDMVVGSNKWIYEQLGEITQSPTAHIPLTIDTDFWTFKREWQPNKNVLMVANRIEGKKGILPVAQACQKLGLQLHLVGAVSDIDYFHQILKCGVSFHQEISDEQLRDLYWQSTIHVTNSVDNFESGTLPLLEAMLCGVPILTRSVGHVPELNNDKNMVIQESDPEDVDNITKLLKDMMTDTSKLDTMRNKAWDTAKTRSHERRAYLYQKLYRQVMWPDQKSVSVIMPVYGGINHETIEAVQNQTYQNLELIICNDDSNPPVENDITVNRNIPVRVINQPSEGYGLAKQRNLGIIEATGEILVFCDQRMKMEPDCIEKLVAKLIPKRWVYGNKGVRKEFVENVSAVYRDDLIKIGMFSERIDRYGGMSQYIRSVAKLNGFHLEFVEEAKATPLGKSKNRMALKPDIIKMKNKLWKMDLQL